jgi:hypothetical protein
VLPHARVRGRRGGCTPFGLAVVAQGVA